MLSPRSVSIRTENLKATATLAGRNFDRRLTAYTLAGGALLATGASVDAGIVSQTLTSNNTVSKGDNYYLSINGVSINVDWLTYNYQVDLRQPSSNIAYMTGGDTWLSALAADTPIGPSGTFEFGHVQQWTYNSKKSEWNTSQGNWANTTAYAGLKLTFADNTTHYGWLQMSVPVTPDYGPITLSGWGYEATADTQILAGATQPAASTAVPEPGSVALALLTTGAGGLAAWRSKRRKATADQAAA